MRVIGLGRVRVRMRLRVRLTGKDQVKVQG